MGEPSEIRVNLLFRGRQLAEFLAIKTHLGIQNNTGVLRYLVHKHARALRRREILLTQRRQGAKAQGKERREGANPDGRRPPATKRQAAAPKEETASNTPAPDLLCLNCPLPECDELDPRCLYQRATGERERQRARTRAYMRRARQ